MLGRRRRIALATVGALGAALILAGCGSSSDQGGAEPASGDVNAQYSVEGDSGGSAPGLADGQDASKVADSEQSSSDADSGGAVAAETPRKMIRTAQVEIRVTDLPSAAVKVRGVATGLGGYVGSEDTSIPPKTDGEPRPDSVATILLRVPESRFEQAMNQVSGLGQVQHRTSNSQDVTEQVADMGSRVASQQASVQRVRAMMTQATTLKDLVLLEGELSQRQAELEALQARLKSVSNQADLSSITVTLTQPGTVEKPPATEEKDGFLGALQNSLGALAAFGSALLVLLGLLLPWLVVLAVIGVIAYFVARWQQRRDAEAPSEPAAATPETTTPPSPEARAPVGAGSPQS